MNEIINNTPEVVETMAETVAKSGGQMKYAAAGFGVGVGAGIGITKLFKLVKQKLSDHKAEKKRAKIHKIEVDVDDEDLEEYEE